MRVVLDEPARRGSPRLMLQDRVALVTGASSGIGRVIALELAMAGASLALVGRSSERLSNVAGIARELGVPASAYAADMTDSGALRTLKARVLRDFRTVDILVHAAGLLKLASVAETDIADFDLQLATNLRGPFVLTQLLLPLLKEQRGQIVFINSSAGMAVPPSSAAYAATKHGLRALADALRQEVNQDGVRVLSLFLGRTATPMQRGVHLHEHREYRPEQLMQPEDIARIIVHILALPATIEVTDVHARPALKP